MILIWLRHVSKIMPPRSKQDFGDRRHWGNAVSGEANPGRDKGIRSSSGENQ
jgi:hypothetical protein